MGAAITEVVSGPLGLGLLSIAVMIVTFLGVHRLIAKGNAHKVSAITWKNRLLGELTLTYRAEEGATQAEDKPSGEVDTTIH
ncbi:hypothetical protein [Streptosporangium pseudovulgare]|uniref:Uncharacterized protein n=1 Tax=Streptosporangium pseudovulgare TaxID=35765 RepID=A0ABQ2QJC6_9ACTN|nr:hypothetical protein [Streptosporangium pseudovulgare]GGP84452.1 hypothetical protein GCM10010140_11950 [Streptosporangium pseudovulgare]